MHFEGDDCSIVDEGVALVIAVTLYPHTGLLDSGIPLDQNLAGNLDALFGAEPTDPDPASLAAPAAVSYAEPAEPSPPPSAARMVWTPPGFLAALLP